MSGSWDFQSVAVVGAGAVGLYYGARLAAGGADVRFLLKSDYEAVQEQGIRIESVAGDLELPQVVAFRSSGEIGPVDLVIVAWKATANDLFESVLPPLLHEGTQILTLQNGMGNGELLAERFGARRVLGGLCFVCLNRLAPGFVSHTAGGRITVGEFLPDGCGRAVAVARRFSAAGIPCEAVPDLEEAQWKKLVWNIPFNGLAIAEGGVTTDLLLEKPATESLIRELMAEVIAAGRARGKRLDDGLIDFNIDRTRPMGAYRPSSMIDYVEGREVEYEAIWGEPLRRAREAGVAAPRMTELAARIRQRIGGLA